MSLYSELAAVYDEVFPPSPSSFTFINSLLAGTGSHSLLDLGCATGTFLQFFQSRKILVAGIELDEQLCKIAQARVGKKAIMCGSMLDAVRILAAVFGNDIQFDVITCLGNTLPHINNIQIDTLFSDLMRLLQPNGWLVLQTLNYSNPSIKPGFKFPLVKIESVEFSRSYEKGPSSDSLIFSTELKVKEKISRNKTMLFPIVISELDHKLTDAGFSEIHHYADWNYGKFDLETSMYAITIARKHS